MAEHPRARLPSPEPRRSPEPVPNAERDTETFESRTQTSARPGIWGVVGVSVLAGWILIMAQMALSGSFFGAPFVPWRAAASVLIGRSALEETSGFPVLMVALVAHFGLSILFGGAYIFALRRFLSRERLQSLGREMAMGALFGLTLWFINFQLIARLFYPWFLSLPQVPQAFLHALAFGLPLGMMLSSVERRLHAPESKRLAH